MGSFAAHMGTLMVSTSSWAVRTFVDKMTQGARASGLQTFLFFLIISFILLYTNLSISFGSC